ncbi:MAG: hypothetical protein GXO14_02310, partial [Thermococci archaeon]|nr:hypothetical protein [Thermococci archaeon]
MPPEEYEKITGFKLPYMNSEVFKQAIENAPSYSQERAKLVAKLKTVLGSAKTNINVADSYLLPKAAVNTLYLPPIGDQGWVGSCNAWSSTYYVWTYMINWWRHNPHPTGNAIMNPI